MVEDGSTSQEELFADWERCIKIGSKNQGMVSFVPNRAQIYIHRQLQQQQQQTGKVRAIILKGRQQGCSTYIAVRFYWQVIHQPGTHVFIMTHCQDATHNLFNIVDRLHHHMPPSLRQPTRIASAKEKCFHQIDSGYRVGTAGNKAVGRSQTIQLLHASEVAFWPHADNHFAGVVQAVPDLPQTEIILESTACGLGNRFHQMWQDAERGQSEYRAIFIPWFWQKEYRKTPPDQWEPDVEARDYGCAYGLDEAQLYWRHCKQQELGTASLFCQEYPATAAESFAVSDETRFIDSQVVMTARHTTHLLDEQAPCIAGCDPARFGNDRTAFCVRQGRHVLHIDSVAKKDTMEVVGLCVRYIQQWHLRKLFIDVVGLGAGVYDRLKELGYGSVIIAVNASSSPMNKDKYHNKRAEMWDQMRQWLQESPCVLPDRNQLQADLTMPGYHYDSHGRLVIEAKEAMRKRGLHSPDEADALALTFAMPVASAWHAGGAARFSPSHRPPSAMTDYDPFC